MAIVKTYRVEVEVYRDKDDEKFVATHNGYKAVGSTEYEAVACVLSMVSTFADTDTDSTNEEKQNLWMKIDQTGIYSTG